MTVSELIDALNNIQDSEMEADGLYVHNDKGQAFVVSLERDDGNDFEIDEE